MNTKDIAKGLWLMIYSFFHKPDLLILLSNINSINEVLQNSMLAKGEKNKLEDLVQQITGTLCLQKNTKMPFQFRLRIEFFNGVQKSLMDEINKINKEKGDSDYRKKCTQLFYSLKNYLLDLAEIIESCSLALETNSNRKKIFEECISRAIMSRLIVDSSFFYFLFSQLRRFVYFRMKRF